MKQQTEEKKKHEVKSYRCSNPNCKSVFSKPKIIKYYVCPNCQTLVEMTATKGGTVKKEEQVPTEKSIKVKKPERKEVEKTKKVRNPETRPLEMAPTEQSALSEDATKPPGCKHNFGYLGSRKKGEVIPDACLECPKSLDCMLFDYYKSKESVAEIKKWYPALHPPA